MGIAKEIIYNLTKHGMKKPLTQKCGDNERARVTIIRAVQY